MAGVGRPSARLLRSLPDQTLRYRRPPHEEGAMEGREQRRLPQDLRGVPALKQRPALNRHPKVAVFLLNKNRAAKNILLKTKRTVSTPPINFNNTNFYSPHSSV